MIVVGIDGSDASKEALRFALHEAALRGTRVRAVHAWSAVPIVAMTGPGMVPAVDPEPIRAAAETTLRDVVGTVAGESARDVERVLAPGPAGDAILEHARDAELIVVGSRGHGAVTGLILGSVSQHVLHHAHGPVVVVPAPRD